MGIIENYSQKLSSVSNVLWALAASLVLSLSFASIASAAPKVSNDVIDFQLVSLSPASGTWGTKVTVTTDATSLTNKRQKSFKVNVNSNQTATVATSNDGGKTYSFILSTFCPEVGQCPAVWPTSGELPLSFRDSYGTVSNTLIFTLVE